MNSKIKRLTTAAIITSIICMSSVLSVNVFGISYSFALFGVFLSGLTLSPTYAFMSNVVYIALGIIGLPIFANFSSGLGTVLGPSGGFIISYPIVAVTISVLSSKSNYKLPKLLLHCSIALTICYIIGVAWYSFVYECPIIQSVLICVLPFVLLDVVKIFLSCYISNLLRKHIKK